uniref:DNA cytosine methyltransferase n=1 Tax=Jeotgalibaca porci TaxID=1868793 RepID=UPI0035A13439
MTPLECFRLQGFPDNLFYKAQEVNSNSQLYKQAGNSVTVNVIEAIANRLTTI